VEDIIRIKTLLPDSVMFDYVNEDQLIVNVDSEAIPSEIAPTEDLYTKNSAGTSSSGAVLYFEFVDGELKPKVNKNHGFGSSAPTLTWNRLPRDRRELRLPEFTPAALTRLITKRNQKFRKAVNVHLLACQKEVAVPSLLLSLY